MRCVPYYACCGAYFLCDITKERIEDTNVDSEKFPKIARRDEWDDRIRTYPDLTKATLRFHIEVQHPNVAYFFAILKQEEKDLGDMLVARGFKLMSQTKDRLLYCFSRDGNLYNKLKEVK